MSCFAPAARPDHVAPVGRDRRGVRWDTGVTDGCQQPCRPKTRSVTSQRPSTGWQRQPPPSWPVSQPPASWRISLLGLEAHRLIPVLTLSSLPHHPAPLPAAQSSHWPHPDGQPWAGLELAFPWQVCAGGRLPWLHIVRVFILEELRGIKAAWVGLPYRLSVAVLWPHGITDTWAQGMWRGNLGWAQGKKETKRSWHTVWYPHCQRWAPVC